MKPFQGVLRLANEGNVKVSGAWEETGAPGGIVSWGGWIKRDGELVIPTATLPLVLVLPDGQSVKIEIERSSLNGRALFSGHGPSPTE